MRQWRGKTKRSIQLPDLPGFFDLNPSKRYKNQNNT